MGKLPNGSFFPPQTRIRFKTSEKPFWSSREQLLHLISVWCKLDMQAVSLPSRSPNRAKRIHKYLNLWISLGWVAEPRVEQRASQSLPSVAEVGSVKDLQGALMSHPCKHHVPGAGTPTCGAPGGMSYVCRSQSFNTKGLEPWRKVELYTRCTGDLGGWKVGREERGGDERCCCCWQAADGV